MYLSKYSAVEYGKNVYFFFAKKNRIFEELSFLRRNLVGYERLINGARIMSLELFLSMHLLSFLLLLHDSQHGAAVCQGMDNIII